MFFSSPVLVISTCLIVLLSNYTHFLTMKACSSGLAGGGDCPRAAADTTAVWCPGSPSAVAGCWTSPHMVQCSQLTQLCQLQQAGWPQHFRPQHFPPSFTLLFQTRFARALGCSWPAGGEMHILLYATTRSSLLVQLFCVAPIMWGEQRVNWIHSLWKCGVMLSGYAKLEFQLLYCPIFVDVGCNMR